MKLCVHVTPKGRDGYLAVCPSLPGCTSEGRTPEEAKERIHEAISGYLAAVSNCVPGEIVLEKYDVEAGQAVSALS